MQRCVETTMSGRSSFTDVVDVLREDPARVFGPRATLDQRRSRAFPDVIAAPLRSGAVVEQEIQVAVGSLRVGDDFATVPVAWHPSGNARLLPTFQGELLVRATDAGGADLTVRGAYQVPFGPIGWLVDRILGRRIARRSLSALLETFAQRLDTEVGRRLRSLPERPAPYPPDLR